NPAFIPSRNSDNTFPHQANPCLRGGGGRLLVCLPGTFGLVPGGVPGPDAWTAANSRPSRTVAMARPPPEHHRPRGAALAASHASESHAADDLGRRRP